MKKTITLLVLAVALLFVGMPVFAEGEVPVRTVTVTSQLPVSGGKWSAVNESNVKIIAVSDGAIKILQAPLEFSMESSLWYDNSTGVPTPLGENDVFISGRSYTLCVRLALLMPETVIDQSTTVFINGKTAKVTPVQEDGSEAIYELSASFVCTPGDIAPKVSLTVEGQSQKEYDGKGVVLTALVEKTDGINYRYEWYCNGNPVSGATAETLSVRNVSASGLYHCKVFATVASDPNENTQFTETSPQEITITPHPVTVQIENAEKNLYDPDPAFTYTVLGEIYDPLTGALSRTEGEDIGTYTISPGTLSFSGETAGNYSLQIKPGTLTVLDAGDLPFSAVANLADLSYITGKGGAKIRVSASKGSIPDGAILSLSLADASARSALESMAGKGIMKSFSVGIVDDKGNKLSLPKYGALRLQIPLTEEEAGLQTDSIGAGLFSDSAKPLEVSVSKNDMDVTYLSVEIKALGTVALFDGVEKAPDGSAPAVTTVPIQRETGGPFLWIIIGVLTACALCAIVFTVIWTGKNRPGRDSTPAPKKKEEVKAEKNFGMEEEEKKEKDRMRRIADELNKLPPVPQKNSREKKPEETAAGTKKVISFEDLED